MATTNFKVPNPSTTSLELTNDRDDFLAAYNQRDLILYALSVGFGVPTSTPDQDELKYLYEKHHHFTAVPTFCLALTFWANERHNGVSGTSYQIPPFPPATMSSTGTIPAQFLKRPVNLSQYPVIHISQSIQWHQDLPVPGWKQQIHTRLRKKVLSITPKKIGAFVTSETQILAAASNNSNALLCTLQMTFLVLGIRPDCVIAMEQDDTQATIKQKKTRRIPTDQPPDFEWTFETSPTQALLYRLASGDSNSIHVVGGDDKMTKALGLNSNSSGPTPILHGLNTFGIAARAIIQYAGGTSNDNKGDVSFERLEGRFTKPVLLNDTLTVKLWGQRAGGQIAFVVLNNTSGGTVVDQGFCQLRQTSRTVSKL